MEKGWEQIHSMQLYLLVCMWFEYFVCFCDTLFYFIHFVCTCIFEINSSIQIQNSIKKHLCQHLVHFRLKLTWFAHQTVKNENNVAGCCCVHVFFFIFVCPLLQALGPALLSCVEPADRISFIEPNFPQHYTAFQSPEPYYNHHNTLGESPPTLQKPANPRLYMGRPGYEFQGYLTSPSYPVTSDLCDPRSV